VLHLVEHAGLHPLIDRVLPLAEAAEGLRLLVHGEAFGKVVLQP
jgi:NADPH:quinone reductase-like Zn-dependent oxidoreductase